MSKISLAPTNDFCPQDLFLYGTYDENGNPDFGLFCWFSYIWDSELGVMACIGGGKLTKDNIHRNRVFSANLVTEKMLPLADYLGCVPGTNPDKMKIDIEIEPGKVLKVPTLAVSPVVYELEVTDFIQKKDGEIMLCKIRNVLQDEKLADESMPAFEKLAAIAPVFATCNRYFGWKGGDLGPWGDPMQSIKI